METTCLLALVSHAEYSAEDWGHQRGLRAGWMTRPWNFVPVVYCNVNNNPQNLVD